MYPCTALFVPYTVLNFQDIDFYFQNQNVNSIILTFWLDDVYVWANYDILSCVWSNFEGKFSKPVSLAPKNACLVYIHLYS